VLVESKPSSAHTRSTYFPGRMVPRARPPARSAILFYFLRKTDEQPCTSGLYSPRAHGPSLEARMPPRRRTPSCPLLCSLPLSRALRARGPSRCRYCKTHLRHRSRALQGLRLARGSPTCDPWHVRHHANLSTQPQYFLQYTEMIYVFITTLVILLAHAGRYR
jgi:hypothetical protein